MGITVSSPESVDMSSDRLSRIQNKFQSYVDAGEAPGFITLIARKGQIVHYETCGYRDLEKQLPIEKDTIFRIYSMTKPITSVALMMLYEQGKFHLFDPVSKYIPEFASIKVLQQQDGGEQVLIEQSSPMTIHHLLTHTSGLAYDFPDDDPDEKTRATAFHIDPNISLEEKIRAIAQYPLLFQPGTRWSYSFASDVCGYLVQVLSGMPLDNFFQEHIFAPMGMVDTAFHVLDDKVSRLATLYQYDAESDSLRLHQDEGCLARDFCVPTQSPFGGHGLVSTTEDYWKFIQMLLNKGELNGTRILGRKTVEFMSINHLKPELFPSLADFVGLGLGFGLGFAVVDDPPQTGVINSVGTYWWGGAAATGFWIDPQEELVAVLMTQIRDGNLPIWEDLRATSYQALVD